MSASSALRLLHGAPSTSKPAASAHAAEFSNPVATALARYLRYRWAHWGEAAVAVLLAVIAFSAWFFFIAKLR